MVEIRGWVGRSQMSFEDIKYHLKIYLQFCPQKDWKFTGGCRGRCKNLEALSANVRAGEPYLRISPPWGVKPKANLLHLTDSWAVWGDEIRGCQAGGGRCRQQSGGRALWTGLSSPPPTLSESQSCLTLWSKDGPRPPSWPGWSCAPSKLCMQQSSRTPALSQPGAQLTVLKVGGGSGYGLKKFLKRKWGFCLWFHCVSLCTAQASPTLLALLCFPNRLMIISFDSCTQLFISATSCKPSDKWAVNCKVCVMFLWALFPATSPMPDT